MFSLTGGVSDDAPHPIAFCNFFGYGYGKWLTDPGWYDVNTNNIFAEIDTNLIYIIDKYIV